MTSPLDVIKSAVDFFSTAYDRFDKSKGLPHQVVKAIGELALATSLLEELQEAFDAPQLTYLVDVPKDPVLWPLLASLASQSALLKIMHGKLVEFAERMYNEVEVVVRNDQDFLREAHTTLLETAHFFTLAKDKLLTCLRRAGGVAIQPNALALWTTQLGFEQAASVRLDVFCQFFKRAVGGSKTERQLEQIFGCLMARGGQQQQQQPQLITIIDVERFYWRFGACNTIPRLRSAMTRASDVILRHETGTLQDWFHLELDVDNVAAWLNSNNRRFVIRPSSSRDDCLVFSYRNPFDVVKHVRIQLDDDGYFMVYGEVGVSHSYDTLSGLLDLLREQCLRLLAYDLGEKTQPNQSSSYTVLPKDLADLGQAPVKPPGDHKDHKDPKSARPPSAEEQKAGVELLRAGTFVKQRPPPRATLRFLPTLSRAQRRWLLLSADGLRLLYFRDTDKGHESEVPCKGSILLQGATVTQQATYLHITPKVEEPADARVFQFHFEDGEARAQQWLLAIKAQIAQLQSRPMSAPAPVAPAIAMQPPKIGGPPSSVSTGSDASSSAGHSAAGPEVKRAGGGRQLAEEYTSFPPDTKPDGMRMGLCVDCEQELYYSGNEQPRKLRAVVKRGQREVTICAAHAKYSQLHPPAAPAARIAL